MSDNISTFTPVWQSGDPTMKEFPRRFLNNVRLEYRQNPRAKLPYIRSRWSVTESGIGLSKGRQTKWVMPRTFEEARVATYTWPGRKQIILANFDGEIYPLLAHNRNPRHMVELDGATWKQSYFVSHLNPRNLVVRLIKVSDNTAHLQPYYESVDEEDDTSDEDPEEIFKDVHPQRSNHTRTFASSVTQDHSSALRKRSHGDCVQNEEDNAPEDENADHHSPKRHMFGSEPNLVGARIRPLSPVQEHPSRSIPHEAKVKPTAADKPYGLGLACPISSTSRYDKNSFERRALSVETLSAEVIPRESNFNLRQKQGSNDLEDLTSRYASPSARDGNSSLASEAPSDHLFVPSGDEQAKISRLSRLELRGRTVDGDTMSRPAVADREPIPRGKSINDLTVLPVSPIAPRDQLLDQIQATSQPQDAIPAATPRPGVNTDGMAALSDYYTETTADVVQKSGTKHSPQAPDGANPNPTVLKPSNRKTKNDEGHMIEFRETHDSPVLARERWRCCTRVSSVFALASELNIVNNYGEYIQMYIPARGLLFRVVRGMQNRYEQDVLSILASAQEPLTVIVFRDEDYEE